MGSDYGLGLGLLVNYRNPKLLKLADGAPCMMCSMLDKYETMMYNTIIKYTLEVLCLEIDMENY